MPLHQPVSRVSASPTLTIPTRLAAAHPRPTAPAPSYRGIVPGFDYKKCLAGMQRQLAAFESQRAEQRIAFPAVAFEERHLHMTDDSYRQTPADRQPTSASTQSEPNEDYPATVSKQAAQYSRFKLPTVDIAMTSATSAAKIEPTSIRERPQYAHVPATRPRLGSPPIPILAYDEAARRHTHHPTPHIPSACPDSIAALVLLRSPTRSSIYAPNSRPLSRLSSHSRFFFAPVSFLFPLVCATILSLFRLTPSLAHSPNFSKSAFHRHASNTRLKLSLRHANYAFLRSKPSRFPAISAIS
ncbi:hypothetical protein LXA43DRAFT_1099498 [Ganoderma leucocontextum]|nr:hypothetical protein LXA43DRAFT_1099498 [Ganoderma leucocontextum]